MLTVRETDSAKPKAKPYKLADGSGLYLDRASTGARRTGHAGHRLQPHEVPQGA